MGAGPTKEQVTNAIRSSLQKAQAEFGGSYVKGTPSTYATLAGDSWQLMVRLLRASNGEAALMFEVRKYGDTPKRFENLSWRAAFKEAGINSVKAAN